MIAPFQFGSGSDRLRYEAGCTGSKITVLPEDEDLTAAALSCI